jgi:hypothetical protein
MIKFHTPHLIDLLNIILIHAKKFNINHIENFF